MSSEIRRGIQLRVAELRDDPDVHKQIEDRMREMRLVYEQFSAIEATEDDQASEPEVPATRAEV